MKKYTTIIIGSGIAAIQLAKHLSRQSQIMMITKSTIHKSNSYRAQGGIAAALAKTDHSSLHYEDTIRAGCSFHNEKEVQALTTQAPNLINQLQREGLIFDTNQAGELSLGMEGAHSQNRIVHCGGDATGKHVVDHLLATLPTNIDIQENQFVYELMIHPITKRCMGIKAKDSKGVNHTYYGNYIVLAVGGIGSLYSSTSNDPTVTGDGIALAYEAGAEIADMEFIQFHPTLLYVDGQTHGLISEAVRGQGARLVNEVGTPLMAGKHPLEDLAPRHLVAREIYEQRLSGHDVYLDISMICDFNEKFPTITSLCEANGVLIEKGRIPVAPGCHFLMGGVAVNSVGQTSIEGLFAVGETAATGVHGANRLASNSLLEGLYYGEKVADFINGLEVNEQPFFLREEKQAEAVTLRLPKKKELQEKMMAYAGIIRTESELEALHGWLSEYEKEIHSFDQYSVDEIQVLFMLRVAKLVAQSALLRRESKGAHIREDFPDEQEQWKEIHIIQSRTGIEMRRKTNERYQIKVHA